MISEVGWVAERRSEDLRALSGVVLGVKPQPSPSGHQSGAMRSSYQRSVYAGVRREVAIPSPDGLSVQVSLHVS